MFLLIEDKYPLILPKIAKSGRFDLKHVCPNGSLLKRVKSFPLLYLDLGLGATKTCLVTETQTSLLSYRD